MNEPIVVVGIGADGWDGLSGSSRGAIEQADVVFGSTRQIAAVGSHCSQSKTWPSPLLPQLRSMIDSFDGSRVCVLASGDPMFFGIGVTLVREYGADRLRIHPAPSSVSLACARLGWALHLTPTVSLVDRPLDSLLPQLVDGRRILVLSRGKDTPGRIAKLLSDNHFGDTDMTVLEQLGGPRERVVRGVAHDWDDRDIDPLNIVALQCIHSGHPPRLTRTPGLPDSVFSGDGQFTKQEVRALTLSALAPAPGEVLWDVGGGSGTIAIEWLRTDSTCRAVSFESSGARRQQIAENATALGVSDLVVAGAAPTDFDTVRNDRVRKDHAVPDALFIGGGLTQPGMIEHCWDVLRPGGRLVANSVTAESDSLLLESRSTLGGDLRRFQIYRGEPLGSFTTWRPQLPVTQWIVIKP